MGNMKYIALVLVLTACVGCQSKPGSHLNVSEQTSERHYKIDSHDTSGVESILLVKINKMHLSPGSHPVWLLHIEYTIREMLLGTSKVPHGVSFWIDYDADWHPEVGDTGLLFKRPGSLFNRGAWSLHPATQENLETAEAVRSKQLF